MNEKKILSLLGIAFKAGMTVCGQSMTVDAVRSGKARLVLVSEDASDNTKKQFTDKCSYYHTPCVFFSTKEKLGGALGKAEKASVAVTDDGFARKIQELLK